MKFAPSGLPPGNRHSNHPARSKIIDGNPIIIAKTKITVINASIISFSYLYLAARSMAILCRSGRRLINHSIKGLRSFWK